MEKEEGKTIDNEEDREKELTKINIFIGTSSDLDTITLLSLFCTKHSSNKFSIEFKFEFINTVLFLVMSDTINITAVFNYSCVCCASYIKYKDFNLCYFGFFLAESVYTPLCRLK